MKKWDKISFAIISLVCAGTLILPDEVSSTPYHRFFEWTKWLCAVIIVIGALILLKQGLSEKQE